LFIVTILEITVPVDCPRGAISLNPGEKLAHPFCCSYKCPLAVAVSQYSDSTAIGIPFSVGESVFFFASCPKHPGVWLDKMAQVGLSLRVNLITKYEGEQRLELKNAALWDIKTQFIPHRRHITSPLQSPDG
jgi:hypothetical protein